MGALPESPQYLNNHADARKHRGEWERRYNYCLRWAVMVTFPDVL